LKFSDRAGMKFIKVAIHGVSKNKLLGIVSIVLEKENMELYPNECNDMIEQVKKEWIKRKYDEKDLAEYISFCKR